MAEILSHLQQYAPCVPYERQVKLTTGEVVKEKTANMHRIIVSGDQLTAARIRGAQKAKLNGVSPEKRLEALVSSFADWHTRANFLGVCSLQEFYGIIHIMLSFLGYLEVLLLCRVYL